jgi:phosphoribosylformylglycinamidine synthase
LKVKHIRNFKLDDIFQDWSGDILDRDEIDQTAALFSESQSRVLVTVGREDDVKFQALCEARGVPCLRIGVTDATSGLVEIKDIADLKLDDIRQGWSGVMAGLFG